LREVSANVTLSVNGTSAASALVPQWTQAAYSMEEAFEVGVDFGRARRVGVQRSGFRVRVTIRGGVQDEGVHLYSAYCFPCGVLLRAS